MFRKALLPALALAMLSGCATDYTYRNGNGDYYYGRPQVEYRHIGGYGYGGYGYGYGGYGAYGGYGYGSPTYYYDRFGRLVYGYPYAAYAAPYSGSYWRHRPRPHHGGGGHDHHDSTGNERRPPWRNIGGMRPGIEERRIESREESLPSRQPAPFAGATPQFERPTAPSMRADGEGLPLMGARSTGTGTRVRAKTPVLSED